MTYGMDFPQKLYFSQLSNLPGPSNFSHHDISSHLTVATCWSWNGLSDPLNLDLDLSSKWNQNMKRKHFDLGKEAFAF